MIATETINEIVARRVQGIEGFNHKIHNISLIGIFLDGLKIQGYTDKNKKVYSIVTPQTFYYWYMLQTNNFNIKYVPEKIVLDASYTEWTLK